MPRHDQAERAKTIKHVDVDLEIIPNVSVTMAAQSASIVVGIP